MPLHVSRMLPGNIRPNLFSLASLAEGLKVPSAARIWRSGTHQWRVYCRLANSMYWLRTCGESVPNAAIRQWRKSSKRHRISPSSLMTKTEIFRCTNAFDSCYFLAHANCGATSGRWSPHGIAGRGGRAASGEALPRLSDHDCPWHSTPFSRSSAVTLTSSGVSSRADEHERKVHVLRHG
jgi:hypothetical protein